MNQCDICGKQQEHQLIALRPEFQTDEIKLMCDSCERVVSGHLWKLRDMSNKMNEHFLKRFIHNLKRKFSK